MKFSIRNEMFFPSMVFVITNFTVIKQNLETKEIIHIINKSALYL